MPTIQTLEEAITILDTLYEEGQDCVLPDYLAKDLGIPLGQPVPNLKYDALRRELQKLAPNSDVFKQVTASKVQVSSKVKHNPPMVSISKACHEILEEQEKQLFKWLTDCTNEATNKNMPVFDLDEKEIGGVKHSKREYNGKVMTYPRDYFCQSFKLDGVALAIYYENGKLVRAGLRPRGGIEGEDVTEQVKYVSSIPQTLKQPITCSIRGELICLHSDFEKVQAELKAAGEPARANPRNHCAGGIRQYRNPAKVKEMRLSFIAYNIVNQDNPPYKTEIEKAKYVAKELGVHHVRVEPFNFYQLKELEEKAKDLDYETDGVVVCVNDIEEGENLGRTGDAQIGNPKSKIAWKFSEEEATPIIKSIEWQNGRTGAITPVAVFDPVPLAGTQVRKTTIHNIGFMMRGKIGVGTKVAIIKSGKIIPKIVRVISGHVVKISHPDVCPSCGEKTVVEQNGEMYELMCNNPDCVAKNIGGLLHYLKTFGVLGLGESKVSMLVEGGKVKTFADFYKLTIEDCMECGLSERQSLLALASIGMIEKADQMDDAELTKMVKKAQSAKKVIPLWKLFAAFGIESAGKAAGKALVGYFGNFDAIREASAAELVIEDIGEKTANIISDYLIKHSKEIDELLKYVEIELPVQGKLSGKIFVLSGGFDGGKTTVEKRIELLGGKVASSVGKTCDFLVQGSEAGEGKAKKAQQYGTAVITAADLEKMLK